MSTKKLAMVLCVGVAILAGTTAASAMDTGPGGDLFLYSGYTGITDVKLGTDWSIVSVTTNVTHTFATLPYTEDASANVNGPTGPFFTNDGTPTGGVLLRNGWYQGGITGNLLDMGGGTTAIYLGSGSWGGPTGDNWGAYPAGTWMLADTNGDGMAESATLVQAGGGNSTQIASASQGGHNFIFTMQIFADMNLHLNELAADGTFLESWTLPQSAFGVDISPYNQKFTQAEFVAAPEPATMSLLVIGGVGALLRRRRNV